MAQRMASEAEADLLDPLKFDATMFPTAANVPNIQLNQILARLSHIDDIGKLVRRWSQVCPGGLVPWSLIEEMLASVESAADRLNQGLNQATSMAAEIEAATSRPIIVVPNMQPTDFSKLYTGTNLRVEVIGILLSIAGLTALTLLEADMIFSSLELSVQDRQSFARDMLSASDTCIAFSDQSFEVNDIKIWLRYKNYLLTLKTCGCAGMCKC